MIWAGACYAARLHCLFSFVRGRPEGDVWAPEVMRSLSLQRDGIRTEGTERVMDDDGKIRHKTYRPDRDGTHRHQFDRNRKLIYATQNICAICGKPVDFSIKAPNPMAASIDHIIPVAKGGHPSDLENLQLCHLQCNRLKGTSTGAPPARQKEKIFSNRDLVLSADWKTF